MSTRPVRGPTTMEICDIGGRFVRLIRDPAEGEIARPLAWDGRDDEGREVPAGIYVVRLTGGGAAAVKRVVRLR